MNLCIDSATGLPRWNFSDQKLGPKEAFAFEAARRLKAHKLTLEQLKMQIIAAANMEWASRGNIGELATLNDVKAKIGKSGKDWFFEIQRVAARPDLLEILIEQEGRGLTALSRLAGPTQAQRRKRYAAPNNTIVIRELVEVLEHLRRALENSNQLAADVLVTCDTDLSKYQKILSKFQ